MNNKFDGFLMSFILIAAGGLFLARNLGYDIELTPTFGVVVFGALSAVCFIRYFAGDLTRWGRLMPACLLAAAAAMIGLSQADVPDSMIALPLFIGFAIPFVVAFLVDRQKNTWAVIPAAVFSTLALTALLADRAAGEFFAALMVFVVAAPFFVVYFTQPKQWWALIPAGILGSVGVTALAGAIVPAFDQSSLRGTLFLLGFAATFGLLYLRRGAIPTEWAKVPALVFSGIALLTLVGNVGINGLPLLLIAVGVIVLVSSLRSRRAIVS